MAVGGTGWRDRDAADVSAIQQAIVEGGSAREAAYSFALMKDLEDARGRGELQSADVKRYLETQNRIVELRNELSDRMAHDRATEAERRLAHQIGVYFHDTPPFGYGPGDPPVPVEDDGYGEARRLLKRARALEMAADNHTITPAEARELDGIRARLGEIADDMLYTPHLDAEGNRVMGDIRDYQGEVARYWGDPAARPRRQAGHRHDGGPARSRAGRRARRDDAERFFTDDEAVAAGVAAGAAAVGVASGFAASAAAVGVGAAVGAAAAGAAGATTKGDVRQAKRRVGESIRAWLGARTAGMRERAHNRWAALKSIWASARDMLAEVLKDLPEHMEGASRAIDRVRAGRQRSRLSSLAWGDMGAYDGTVPERVGPTWVGSYTQNRNGKRVRVSGYRRNW